MYSVRAYNAITTTLEQTKARFIGIGESDWEFSTTFDVSDDEFDASKADLVFDGLDTFATVTLVRQIVECPAIYSDGLAKNGTELAK